MGVSRLSHLFVCNTSSDYISKVNLAMFKEECKILLGLDKNNRVGPHGMCVYKDMLLVANSYSNSLSIISLAEEKEIENYFIGMHCNGVEVFEDNAYIICGELNNVIVFNLIKKKIIEEIPCGSFPHSISISKSKKCIVVSNMHSDNITLIDCRNRESIFNIKVSSYPTKAIFDQSGKYILVCESNMGIGPNGTLCIIEGTNLKVIERIKVGNSPVDIFCDKHSSYISNFGDGSVSIVDIDKLKEVKKIKLGGMPMGIFKSGRYIYVGDNYNNLLIQVDVEKENKKAISIGGEPTGMTIC
jgi:DNA-binding beta-propeller fold protein YncE